MKSLDRPVWASLTHAPHLADGDDLARRYRRDVNLFASACDDSINSLAALRDLVPQGESVFVLQVPAIRVPDGLVVARAAQGVQMLAARSIEREDGDCAVVELGEADAPEMLALAQLTEASKRREGRSRRCSISGASIATAFAAASKTPEGKRRSFIPSRRRWPSSAGLVELHGPASIAASESQQDQRRRSAPTTSKHRC